MPALRAYQGEDFILLAPREQDGYMKGMLIALESASGSARAATSPEGDTIYLDVPHIETKVIAKENQALRIARR